MRNLKASAAFTSLTSLAAFLTISAAHAATVEERLKTYMPQSPEAEVSLARSAAPAAVSSHADILAFSAQGYKRAARGNNGFTCLVERSWAKDPGDKEFWNPRMRAPMCLNPAAARTILPAYLERTKWVLSGASEAQVKSRVEQAVKSGRIAPPQAGAMSYMMSKAQYLSDDNGHPWHPHVMFYYPASVARESWGADVEGSPILSDSAKFDRVITFMVPVARWSDGSPAFSQGHH